MFTAIDGRGVWFDPIRDTLDSRTTNSFWYFKYPDIRSDLALVIPGHSLRLRYLLRFSNLQRLVLPRDPHIMRELNFSVLRAMTPVAETN
jgi:hypothetical protein